MKLRELHTTTEQTGLGLADPPEESIRVARLPRAGDPDLVLECPPSPEPPSLRFVTDEPRAPRLRLRTALGLITAMIAVVVVLIVVASSSGGAADRPHNTAVKLTPAQQRAVAAQRARAAAIAKAKRDRGTDAELQDTIPAATPMPSS